MKRPAAERFSQHRDRFATATARTMLASVERLVLDRRWTAPRSIKLDKAIVRYERPTGGSAA